MNYRILPPEGFVEARVALPPSKSMLARVMVINALAGSPVQAAADGACDDVALLAAPLSGSRPATVDAGASGTAMRFLTAYFAAVPGDAVTIDGCDRLRERPVGPLVDALRELGGEIEYLGREGFPPLRVTGRRLRGGELTVDASVSSQFISALLLVAPLMSSKLTLTLAGNPVSLPYVQMTRLMMQQAGIETDFYGGDTVTVEPGNYSPLPADVEGDWSAAAPWYEIEALSSGVVDIDNIGPESVQGDSILARIFHSLGVVTDFEPEEAEGTELLAHPDMDARLDLDLTGYPDIVPSLTVTCCMLGVPFSFTGLDSLRIKECDRVAALVAEMAKTGAILQQETQSSLSWDGRRMPVRELPRFATYGDHRMAMALAPVALYVPGIVIEDIEVVSKSYPGFWADLEAAGFAFLDGDAPLDQAGRAAGNDRALIILAFTVVVGFLLWLTHKPGEPQPAANDGEPEQEECCGLHEVCEKKAIQLQKPVYFDDEELDRFAGDRDPQSYTSAEIEEFREVLYTLLPADIEPWGFSIEARGIVMPAEIRDEWLMLISENQQS